LADSFAQAGAKFAALASALDGAAVVLAAHRRIGAAGKTAALAHGGTMHGRNRRPVRLGAGYDVDAQRVQIKPRPAGMWAIREKGAEPHREPKVRARGRGRRAPLLLATGDVVDHVDEAHASPRPAWGDVRADVVRVAPRIVDEELVKTLGRFFARGG